MAQRPTFPGRPKPKGSDDLGAPMELGSPKPAPPRSNTRTLPPAETDLEMEESLEAEPNSAMISPEAVRYHDDEQRCDVCQHLGRGNQCAVLQMPVEPEGGCTAFRGRATETNDEFSDDELADDDLGEDEEFAPAAPGRGRYA